MRIQGKKLRERDPIQKNNLYSFAGNKIISFDEEGSGKVDIDYRLREEQVGYYCYEYRPTTVPANGAKTIDITAFVIDELQKRVKGCLYEVKKTVGGKDELLDLCEQWNAGIKYWRHSVVTYLDDCTVEEEIGVFADCYDAPRIQSIVAQLEQEMSASLEDFPQILRNKMKIERLKSGKALQVLQNFLCHRITYKDGSNEEELPIRVVSLADGGADRHHLIVEV